MENIRFVPATELEVGQRIRSYDFPDFLDRKPSIGAEGHWKEGVVVSVCDTFFMFVADASAFKGVVTQIGALDVQARTFTVCKTSFITGNPRVVGLITT